MRACLLFSSSLVAGVTSSSTSVCGPLRFETRWFEQYDGWVERWIIITELRARHWSKHSRQENARGSSTLMTGEGSVLWRCVRRSSARSLGAILHSDAFPFTSC